MSDLRYLDDDERINIVSLVDKSTRKRQPARQTSANGPEWLKGCMRRDGDHAIANVANALHAIRSAPELAGVFAFDAMRCTAVLRKPLLGVASEIRPVRDTDVTRVQEWLQCQGLPKVGVDTLHQAVDLVALENEFHRSVPR